jgi:hypothetical protein
MEDVCRFLKKGNECLFEESQVNKQQLGFCGIQQTLQKNSVGIILWDGITVRKDQIPWEKDRQSVLFYAPAPKTHGNFTLFLLTLYKKTK